MQIGVPQNPHVSSNMFCIFARILSLYQKTFCFVPGLSCDLWLVPCYYPVLLVNPRQNSGTPAKVLDIISRFCANLSIFLCNSILLWFLLHVNTTQYYQIPHSNIQQTCALVALKPAGRVRAGICTVYISSFVSLLIEDKVLYVKHMSIHTHDYICIWKYMHIYINLLDGGLRITSIHLLF